MIYVEEDEARAIFHFKSKYRFPDVVFLRRTRGLVRGILAKSRESKHPGTKQRRNSNHVDESMKNCAKRFAGHWHTVRQAILSFAGSTQNRSSTQAPARRQGRWAA
jgi:hypothetical protein